MLREKYAFDENNHQVEVEMRKRYITTVDALDRCFSIDKVCGKLLEECPVEKYALVLKDHLVRNVYGNLCAYQTGFGNCPDIKLISAEWK